uniref:Guanylate cyclase n=1 Tax=Sphaeramia orbicularis TaxID=375764 RepID=A0A673ATZ2_9TELE
MQHCQAFLSFPQKWRQTPDKSPDPSASPPSLHHHFSFPPPASLHLSPPPHPSLHGLFRFLVVLFASICFHACSVEGGWFRVGVLGPWGCDPIFAKALPSVAAQLAVNRINKDPSLCKTSIKVPDYFLFKEPCETSRALEAFVGFHTKASAYIGPSNPGYCDSASMLTKGWNKALFPWGCVGYEMDNVRSHPTFARSMPRPTWVLLNMMKYFKWAQVAIISSSEDIWVETATKVADSLRSHGLPVRLVIFMENTPHGIRRTLAKVRKRRELRVVILCMHSALIGGEAQKLLLETAYDMQMIDGSLVFVPYDTLLYSLPYRNVTYPALKNNSKLLRAYDAVLTITIDSPQVSFYEAFREAMDRREVSPLFGTIYSSIVFTAHAVHRLRKSGEWMSGGNLAQHTRNLAFQGFSHPIKTNSSGAALLNYLILDTNGLSWELKPTYRIDMENHMVHFLGREIHFPRGYGPRKDSLCWFTPGVLCSGGEDTQRTVHPVITTVWFTLDIFSSDHRLQNENTKFGSVSVLQGDWAWLKRLPHGTFSSINPKTSDVFELDMRHENVNPFLGFFHDCGVFAIMTEFCSRGSLEDLLLNDDVKLDWMFKSSLLLDLIKGMKYLHHRGVCHSRLKSRNCVVDGRFVLKVTDYGYMFIILCVPELLWTAPEILRTGQGGFHGTLPGDVYSFAIIMQEVVIRGPPFCMLDLPATELIEKLCRPPPLCRPVVSPDYAPLECIQLMKQCWNEQPDKRPTFEDVFDQFKNINKGKKTNIIDSMLRMLEQYSSNLEELIRERTEELEIEKQKTEKLLTQMLPPSVAEALKVGGTVVPEHFESASLYFSDIVGFTTISANSEPIEVVDLLNDLYTVFDAIIGNHDVYKVETIGDAYMVSSGVPVLNDNRHAAEIANMALDILSAVGTFKMRHMPDVPVRIRIGLHTGPVVAGVVGLTMPRYCLFGDTVTTASRMESSGLPYRIHVHQSTVKILRELNLGYKVELRGRTEVRGKGIEETYWLVGRDGFTKPLPVPPDCTAPVDKQYSSRKYHKSVMFFFFVFFFKKI